MVNGAKTSLRQETETARLMQRTEQHPEEAERRLGLNFAPLFNT
jgi:hypothetical protein